MGMDKCSREFCGEGEDINGAVVRQKIDGP